MSCNCQHRAAESPEQIISKVKKGTVKFCDVCDPCNECVTNVKICAFVVPTLEEGRYFKNSFIFVQEDDSVYFISDDRSEIPFGSRPKFIDNFDPEDPAVNYKSCVVYDLVNQTAYVYGPDGTYMTIAMTATPFSSLTGADGILVTATGGNYTVAADWNEVAKKGDLDDVTTLATNHTRQINDLQDAQDTMAGDIETIEDDLDHVHDLVDDANELAVEAKENAAAAQQTANDAMSTANAKQDALTAGANITISNNVISAADTTYEAATTTQEGLMSATDKAKLDSLVVDPALNSQSTNPVQNAAIASALDGKQSIYPVGAVYSSTDSNAPDFTGTWTAIGNQTIGTSTVYYYERTA